MITIPATTYIVSDGSTVIAPVEPFPQTAIQVIPGMAGYDVYMPGDEQLLAERLAAQEQQEQHSI